MRSSFRFAGLAFLALPIACRAGLGPESVAVVVNADSWASITVANEYARLRHIPDCNIVFLSGLSAFDAMDAERFRSEVLGPVVKAIDGRGLKGQIDCIAYSVDLPSAVHVHADMAGKPFQQVITPVASANGLTYLSEWFLRKDTDYLRLDINRYSRRTLPLADGAPLSPKDRAEYQRGMTLYDAKKYPEAAAVIAALVREPRNDPSLYYNLACCQALAGRPDEAMATLIRGVSIGWRNAGQTTSDPDLESLRQRADFKELIEEMKSRRVEIQPTRGFRAAYAWDSRGEPAADGSRYMLSTMLGVSSGRGNSVAEVLACLRRAAGADGSSPAGTVYFLRNGDVRSATREWAFPDAMAQLKKLGIGCLIEEGVLPAGRRDVAGAVVGIAEFKWNDSRSTILPGAICEHLTSCGGMMGERDGQTPCTDFIRAGAAGSSGAVTEPFALQEKFPNAFMHLHYARGSTLAEAFYQSLEGPYQLLIIGDPLCRPWGKARPVTLEGAKRNDVLKGSVELKARGDAGATGAASFEYFLDGARIGTTVKGGSVTFDTTAQPDGDHILSVVGTRADALETRDRLEIPVRIANSGRVVVVAGRPPARVAWGKPLSIELSSQGAAGLELTHLGRTVGTCLGERGMIEIDTTILGTGRVQLRPVARFSGTNPKERAFGPEIELDIEPPQVGAGRTSPATPTKGLALSVDGGPRSTVADMIDPAFIATRVPDGTSFDLVGVFDAPQADLYQVQIRTNTGATVEVDGVKLVHAADNAWHYAPARLAPGPHRLHIHGVVPARAAEARLDVRVGCAGTAHPSEARFRCDPK